MTLQSTTASVEKKVFFRYKDGAKHYSMSMTSFKKLAEEAGAVYKYGKIALVNSVMVDEYLENFREQPPA